jgi:hypothetical protein
VEWAGVDVWEDELMSERVQPISPEGRNRGLGTVGDKSGETLRRSDTAARASFPPALSNLIRSSAAKNLLRAMELLLAEGVEGAPQRDGRDVGKVP